MAALSVRTFTDGNGNHQTLELTPHEEGALYWALWTARGFQREYHAGIPQGMHTRRHGGPPPDTFPGHRSTYEQAVAWLQQYRTGNGGQPRWEP